jgi:uncharacterized membrane protein
MSKVEEFLSAAEEQEIVEAIKVAEKNTSGEIRVHLEKKTDLDVMQRTLEVFEKLEMHKTKDSNGVLIYVAVKDKKFVIYGDKGINEKVKTTFWDATKEVIQSHFKNGNFKQGLIDGILQAGEELKHHFPYQDDDTDELSNEISKE